MRYASVVIRRIWLIVLYCLLIAVPALAVDQVDMEFGNNGFATKDFGMGDDEALAVALQPDGKLLAAGYSDNGAVKNITVTRYLSGGHPDVSFNNDGVFTDNLGSGDSVAHAVAVLDDGRILVAGSSLDMGEPRLVVIALTEDGFLDSEFGDNGKVVFPVQDEGIVTADLKIAEDGFVFISATIERGDSHRYPLFAKISSAGEFAPDFGEDGIVLRETDYSIEVHGLDLVDEGKIIAAGSIEFDEAVQAGLLRLNADGTPDTSFGDEGELLLGIEGTGSVINALFLESAGSVLLAGSVKNENYHQAFAARLLENGTLDAYFAGSGLFQSNLTYDNVAYGIAVQPDQTIVLVGTGLSGQGKDLIVWSIMENEVTSLSNEDMVILDAEQQIVLRALSVSESNIEQAVIEDDAPANQTADNIVIRIITDIADGDDTGYAAAALSTGQIVVAGSSSNGSDKDFVLIRYKNEEMSGALLSQSLTEGVVTGSFKVMTTPVQDISRVGAVTGGTILVVDSLSCETSCTEQCIENSGSNENSGTECSDINFDYDTCVTTCEEGRTITKRGVVFSVYPNPVYRTEEAGATDTDTADTADTGILGSTGGKSYIYDKVRSGQTDDGSGIGSYGSDIQEITPNVTYYVRAYGIMVDGTVIYGNQLPFKTEDACFIATAAYGTLLDGHVVLLRQFRDTFLIPYSLGSKIVGAYYHFSPVLADIIDKNSILRGVIRIALWPFVGFALFMLKVPSTFKIIVIVLAAFLTVFYLRPKIYSQKS